MTESITKGCLTVSVALILLSIFCAIGSEKGTSAFYLSIITLIINIAFSGALTVKLITANRRENNPKKIISKEKTK